MTESDIQDHLNITELQARVDAAKSIQERSAVSSLKQMQIQIQMKNFFQKRIASYSAEPLREQNGEKAKGPALTAKPTLLEKLSRLGS